MKFSSVCFLSLFVLISCGSNNESGKSSSTAYSDSSLYSANEEAIRKDFVSTGKSLLNQYRNEIDHLFGNQVTALIRSRLRLENIQVTERVLYNERNDYTRSNRRQSEVTLYVGSERPELRWGRSGASETSAYQREVMHELLELGGIQDRNYAYTDQIMGRKSHNRPRPN